MLLSALLPLATQAVLSPVFTLGQGPGARYNYNGYGAFVDLPGQKYPFYQDNTRPIGIFAPLDNGSYGQIMKFKEELYAVETPCAGCPTAYAVATNTLAAYDFSSKTPDVPLYNVTMRQPTYSKLTPSEDGSLVGWAANHQKQDGEFIIVNGKTGEEVRTITLKNCYFKNSECEVRGWTITGKFAVIDESYGGNWNWYSFWDISTGKEIYRYTGWGPHVADGYAIYSDPHFNQILHDLAKNSTKELKLGGDIIYDFQPKKKIITAVSLPKTGKGQVRRFDITTRTFGPTLLEFDRASGIGVIRDPYVLQIVGDTQEVVSFSIVNLDTQEEKALDRQGFFGAAVWDRSAQGHLALYLDDKWGSSVDTGYIYRF